MDPKPRSITAKTGVPARPAAVKRAQGIAETGRLFLDVEGMIKRSRSQPLSLSRYVE
jgi:hypothetical protein